MDFENWGKKASILKNNRKDRKKTEDTVWYRSGSATNSAASSHFGSRAARLSGTGNHRVLQRYNVSLPADSTFILTGWGKANADPNGVAAKTNDSDSYFGLIAHLYYSDGNDDVFYCPFDVYYTGWQYTEDIAVPKSATNGATITKIYIAAAYDNNFGAAYIDDGDLVDCSLAAQLLISEQFVPHHNEENEDGCMDFPERQPMRVTDEQAKMLIEKTQRKGSAS